jgi:hypothetical protein
MDGLPPNYQPPPGRPLSSEVQNLTPEELYQFRYGPMQDMGEAAAQALRQRDWVSQQIDKPRFPTTGQQ